MYNNSLIMINIDDGYLYEEFLLQNYIHNNKFNHTFYLNSTNIIHENNNYNIKNISNLTKIIQKIKDIGYQIIAVTSFNITKFHNINNVNNIIETNKINNKIFDIINNKNNNLSFLSINLNLPELKRSIIYTDDNNAAIGIISITLINNTVNYNTYKKIIQYIIYEALCMRKYIQFIILICQDNFYIEDIITNIKKYIDIIIIGQKYPRKKIIYHTRPRTHDIEANQHNDININRKNTNYYYYDNITMTNNYYKSNTNDIFCINSNGRNVYYISHKSFEVLRVTAVAVNRTFIESCYFIKVSND